jgi:hypothetical protein
MEHESMHNLSLVKEYKRNWGNTICLFLSMNVEQIKSANLDEQLNLILNSQVYKFDVSEYTGHSEKYVFFNPLSGRLLIESNGMKKIYKFEVSLFDENEKF